MRRLEARIHSMGRTNKTKTVNVTYLIAGRSKRAVNWIEGFVLEQPKKSLSLLNLGRIGDALYLPMVGMNGAWKEITNSPTSSNAPTVNRFCSLDYGSRESFFCSPKKPKENSLPFTPTDRSPSATMMPASGVTSLYRRCNFLIRRCPNPKSSSIL